MSAADARRARGAWRATHQIEGLCAGLMREAEVMADSSAEHDSASIVRALALRIADLNSASMALLGDDSADIDEQEARIAGRCSVIAYSPKVSA